VPEISLKEVTATSVRAVCALDVSPEQRSTLRQTQSRSRRRTEPCAWFRAIYADETPIGFVMLHEDRKRGVSVAVHGRCGLQRHGYGRRALDLVAEHVRAARARELVSSYVPGPAGPEDFYRRYGFKETGDIEDGEVVIQLDL
jgi:diamine N-acetyltransferase